MPNWQSEIHLKDLFDKYDEGKITLDQLIKETIERCKNNQFYPLFKHNAISIEEALTWFESRQPQYKDELGYLENKFDEFMDNLYDFGDFQDRIHVITQ